MNLSKASASWPHAEKLQRVAKVIVNPSAFLLPKICIRLADPERTFVDEFISQISNTSERQLLLDAGAGSFRYKEILLQKGYIYESQDFEEAFDKSTRGSHTYVCDIQNIPVESHRYDIIVCTQVLEHLANPQTVFSEFARILKPGGRLYLTTNFLFPVHGAPYDFFRFTNFGLFSLSQAASFSDIQITSRGGFFSLCAKILFDFPAITKSWLFYGGANPHGQRELSLKNPLLIAIAIPGIIILDLCCTLSASIIRLLDPIDKRKRFTLGYQLIAIR